MGVRVPPPNVFYKVPLQALQALQALQVPDKKKTSLIWTLHKLAKALPAVFWAWFSNFCSPYFRGSNLSEGGKGLANKFHTNI